MGLWNSSWKKDWPIRMIHLPVNIMIVHIHITNRNLYNVSFCSISGPYINFMWRVGCYYGAASHQFINVLLVFSKNKIYFWTEYFADSIKPFIHQKGWQWCVAMTTILGKWLPHWPLLSRCLHALSDVYKFTQLHSSKLECCYYYCYYCCSTTLLLYVIKLNWSFYNRK